MTKETFQEVLDSFETDQGISKPGITTFKPAFVVNLSSREENNPYLKPQHWLSDYPKPPKYERDSDRGATDEGW